MNPRNFFAELKRRNVYKVAVAYAVVGWLVMQIAATVVPALHLPGAITSTVVLLTILGFPIALVLAWAFEITPEGIVRTEDIEPGKSITRKTGRKFTGVILAVSLAAFAWFLFESFPNKPGASPRIAPPPPDAKSIAVLPFVNLSGDPKNNDFSDGVTEEIINALAQIADLKVAARTSAFQFKGQNVDLRRVGETLDVAYVLEGSVQRTENDVRITAQLIDARSGYHRWSAKYDRKLTNIFAIEDEISKSIAAHMQVTLGNAQHQPLVKAATANPAAHEFYLKGLARLTERGSALTSAVEFFKKATELDPNYAAAWAGLAQAYELLPWYDLNRATASVWSMALAQAEEAARRAQTLDPQLAEGHTALANVLRDRGDFAQATQEYRLALELSPGSAETLNQYGQMLFRMGRLEEALQLEGKALALDPLAFNPRHLRGTLLCFLHRYDEAIAEYQTVMARNPAFTYSRFELAYVYLYVSKYAEAEQAARAAAAQVGEDPEAIAALVRAMANPAERPAAFRLLAERKVGRYSLGELSDPFWYAMLGAPQEALTALEHWARSSPQGERFARSRSLWAPAFDSLRGEERFRTMMQSLGLPNSPVPLEAMP